MKYFNDEKNILKKFRSVPISECYCSSEPEKKIFSLIHNEKNWSNWKDSSGKADLPPDYFSEEFGLMMDVMRIDDHGFKNKKGKIVNPTYARESQLEDELKNSEILHKVPHVFVIPDTGLPTIEDHNYIYYQKNFKNIISNHINKIKSYRQNHPEFKVIFFVMDESSAYFQSVVFPSEGQLSLGDILKGRPHLHWMDDMFLEVIRGSEIDYLIWFTPFKHLISDNLKVALPKVCVLDIKELEKNPIKYDAENMISAEI